MLAFPCKLRCRPLARLNSSHATLPSRDIRDRFIKYFVNENDHSYVRSCPLKPISDTSIPFVNAGMVQFKPVLLGTILPPALRVANSQKCARVGGKHNDLDTVGMDGYHHTFFEMLGSWSFGECNKQEACEMAWNLLTGPFGLSSNRLYITYFGGDKALHLEPDVETKEIWRALGVQESHILPFGAKDNFWEMGALGPCGPCTEIHVDHVPQRGNAAHRVNAGFSDLTELWNIVFIQYNRTQGGLNVLKQSHVDTGMGFERLVAVLNGVDSNYDTDLFQPLLTAIHKIAGLSSYSASFDPSADSFIKDKAYRILCDHSRLIAVALSDNILPRHECKLRWVLRRALDINRSVMKQDVKLLVELTNHVAESLYSIYPEVGKNLLKIQRIILDEADIYKALREDVPKNWLAVINANPEVEDLLAYGSNKSALATSFQKVSSLPTPDIPPELSFHLYDSHGMNVELIGRIADLTGKTFDVEQHEKELERVRNKSKMATASGETIGDLEHLFSSAKIPKTNDRLKYDYELKNGDYSFPPVSSKIVGLVLDGEFHTSVEGGKSCGLILERTNFYHDAGGQVSDTGEILSSLVKGPTFYVKDVKKVGGYVIHYGNINGRMEVGDSVITKINKDARVGCMRNHTLAHLINGEMQHRFRAPLLEKCAVKQWLLKLTYYLHGEEFTSHEAKILEDVISHTIDQGLPVDRYTVNMWQIPPSTTLVPDETYPVDDIHILDIKNGRRIVSREACCGTHVINTKHIGKFCIVDVLRPAKKVTICVVTGKEAEDVITNSRKVARNIDALSESVSMIKSAVQNKLPSSESEVTSYSKELKRIHKQHIYLLQGIVESKEQRRVSYVTKDAAEKCLQSALQTMIPMARTISELQIKNAAADAKFLVHSLPLSELLEKPVTNRFLREVNIPMLLFYPRKTELKIHCFVPMGMVSEDFNALQWMQQTVSSMELDVHRTIVSSPMTEKVSGHFQSRIVHFNKSVNSKQTKVYLAKGEESALNFANTHFKLKCDSDAAAKS